MAKNKITQKQVNKMQKASRREWFIENNIPIHKEKVYKDKKNTYNRQKSKKIDID
jgi:hypothetical protein